MRRVRSAAGFAGVLLLFAFAGCTDPDTGEVTGTVTVDSAPAPEETSVQFTPTDGVRAPQGCKLKDGKYAVRVAVGVSKVSAVANKQTGVRQVYKAPNSPTAPKYDDLLGGRYDATRTTLTYDVKPGTQVHDLDLKTK